MSFMEVLSGNMVTANVLLALFFLSGALAYCPQNPNLLITAPQTIEALSGSCLIIPCNFSTTTGLAPFNSALQIFGSWMKSDPFRFAVYNSSNTSNIYPMNITGNLKQNMCTTLFSNLTTNYSDSYYLRIANGPFQASACANPVNITVKDAPQSPCIEIPGDLKEGETVNISCSAFTPCPQSPPKLTWTLQQNPHSNTQENTDGSFTTRIQETITLSEQHDGNNISCSASYPVNEGGNVKTAETQATLNVSYAPKDTSASISPSGLVSAGTWVNLTCSSRAKPPVNSFTWFQISTNGTMTVSKGAVYSFNAAAGGAYYCVAANALGSQTSPQISLSIAGPVTAPQWGPVLAGIFVIIVLICLIICVWRFKSTRDKAQHTQSQTTVVPATKGVVIENIQYGELDFSKQRPEESSDPVQDSGQKDIVYAQVKVSNTENGAPPAADGPEDVCTQK